MPGWQITLIATGSALLAAMLAALLDRAGAARRHITARALDRVTHPLPGQRLLPGPEMVVMRRQGITNQPTTNSAESAFGADRRRHG